jgi:hypothetical protein
MTIKSRLVSGAIVATILGIAPLVCLAEAKVVSHSKDIIVVLPTSLPELAQRQGIAFQLYSGSSDGKCYLYIEQHQGERLLVLDVTNPANIKLVNTEALTVPGPFDFVRTLGNSAVLLRFRNNHGTAVLDLRKPKKPALKAVAALTFTGHTESLGDSAFLMADEQATVMPSVPRDYQVADTSNPADPSLLYTVKKVNGNITRAETGTVFLLGSEGLTIIRHPREEAKYQDEESYTN